VLLSAAPSAASRFARATAPIGPLPQLSVAQTWNDYDRYWLPSVTDYPSHAVVLVVEDDIFERMGASDMFLGAGYRVLEAGNADEALRFFETGADIGLLFTDVSMPGSMSGADLARQVAARWPAIGIIVASGRPRPDRLPPSMRFHEKPYAPTAILRHAREMMLAPG
jgi:two-component system, response regulator PdtaR